MHTVYDYFCITIVQISISSFYQIRFVPFFLRSLAESSATSHSTNTERQRYLPTPKKIAKSSGTFCIICGLSIASWVPVTVSIYVSLFCLTCGNLTKGKITSVTVAFMLITKILNPWIYCLRNRHFRSVFKMSIKGKCHRRQVRPESNIYFTNMWIIGIFLRI